MIPSSATLTPMVIRFYFGKLNGMSINLIVEVRPDIDIPT